MCLSLSGKKLSDSTLLGPLGVGRVASTAFYSFFSPSLPPSFSEPRSSRSSSSSRSCRDPGFIILSRCGSIWIDFGGAVHRVTRWMTQKERVIRRERWSRHFPEEKKRKRKIKNPPPLPFFFWFFWGGERRREVSLIFFCACEKMIRVISKTFCRTEEEAWKSAFWGDPNSPTDDFNKREEKKKIRGGGGQRVVVFLCTLLTTLLFFSLLPRETERHRP